MQEFGYDVTGQNRQPFSAGQYQHALPQRPSFQAAGVYNAQPVADARPSSQQQLPLQQIPFLPQPASASRPASKPKLFVPGQRSTQPAAAVSLPSVAGPAPTQSQPAPVGRQHPAVSSRLSALKARLDTEKQKAGGEPYKAAR